MAQKWFREQAVQFGAAKLLSVLAGIALMIWAWVSALTGPEIVVLALAAIGIILWATVGGLAVRDRLLGYSHGRHSQATVTLFEEWRLSITPEMELATQLLARVQIVEIEHAQNPRQIEAARLVWTRRWYEGSGHLWTIPANPISQNDVGLTTFPIEVPVGMINLEFHGRWVRDIHERRAPRTSFVRLELTVSGETFRKRLWKVRMNGWDHQAVTELLLSPGPQKSD